jgi:hypothetical protein
MKKFTRLLLILLISIPIISCTKDTLLTKDIWLLEQSVFYYKDLNLRGISFWKQDSTDSMKFNKNNMLDYAGLTTMWIWDTDDKKAIIIEATQFNVSKLNHKVLILSNESDNLYEILYYRHPNDPKWADDESVDMMNSLSVDGKLNASF